MDFQATHQATAPAGVPAVQIGRVEGVQTSTEGVFVDLTMLPSNQPLRARGPHTWLGAGGAISHAPTEIGALALVVIPDDEPNGDPVIVGFISSDSFPLPQKVADAPDDTWQIAAVHHLVANQILLAGEVSAAGGIDSDVGTSAGGVQGLTGIETEAWTTPPIPPIIVPTITVTVSRVYKGGVVTDILPGLIPYISKPGDTFLSTFTPAADVDGARAMTVAERSLDQVEALAIQINASAPTMAAIAQAKAAAAAARQALSAATQAVQDAKEALLTARKIAWAISNPATALAYVKAEADAAISKAKTVSAQDGATTAKAAVEGAAADATQQAAAEAALVAAAGQAEAAALQASYAAAAAQAAQLAALTTA
jgi:hypothetical protein